MEKNNPFMAGHVLVNLKSLKGLMNINHKTIQIDIIKIPNYTTRHSQREKICEGGGWYSQGDIKHFEIEHNNEYLCIYNNLCLGMFYYMKTKSGKVPIMKLNHYANQFLKTI